MTQTAKLLDMLANGAHDALLEAVPDALVIVGQDGLIVLVNEKTEKMFGYERADLLGQPIEVLVPARYRGGHVGHRDAYLGAPRARPMGVGLDLSGKRKDGSEFPCEISLAPMKTDKGTWIIAAVRDITERKKAEAFRRLLESAPDAMVMVSKAGRILLVNARTEQLFGYLASELLEQPIEMLLPERFHAVHPHLREGYFGAQQPRNMAAGRDPHARRKDGTEFPVEVSLSPIDTPDGPCVTAAIRDVSERLRIEEIRRKSEDLEAQNLRMQEANRLKSEFLANMSHELRTPLNAIIGFAELMHTGKVGPLSDDHKEYLGDILTSSRHLLQLINDVLDLAKVESGKMEFRPEPIDPAKLVGEVRDILRGLSAQKRIRVEIQIDPALPPVHADPARLKQVLYNYLSNAIKFTPEEGRVFLRVRPVEKERFRIEVQDTGIGIRPEDRHRLFVEFQQLDASIAKKHAGTGLGLALTRRIVEACGGIVGVDSTLGVGSTFFAEMPYQPKVDREPDRSQPQPGANAGEPEVLIVEDTASDQEWLRSTLERAGFVVWMAATGAQAIELGRRRTFDAITLDMLLPDMGGWQVLEQLRSTGANRQTPVVVITVVPDADKIVAGRVSDLLAKPVSEHDVLAALERAGVMHRVHPKVLLVDDDATTRKLAATTLTQAGYEAIAMATGEAFLGALAEVKPAAAVIDLLMPGMDGREVLRQLRALPESRDLPVIMWTVADITAQEQLELLKDAQAVVQKTGSGATQIIMELRRLLPTLRRGREVRHGG